MQDLGTLGGGWAKARGVNADGSVVVGEAQISGGGGRAFRWEKLAGHVFWGPLGSSEIPAANVRVRAFRIDGLGSREFLDAADNPDATYTDANGFFSVPDEFLTTPKSATEEYRGLLAELEYQEIGSDPEAPRVIRNYAGWDHLTACIRTADLTTPEEIELEAEENLELTIHIPYPVVFQPGVSGVAAIGGSAGTEDTGLRGVLTTDSFLDPLKDQRDLPAFPFFCMPSQDERDDWGYYNFTPNDWLARRLAKPREVLENARRLRYHIAVNVMGEMGAYQGPDSAGPLPLYLCGHSYGGVLSRKWMHMNQMGAFAVTYEPKRYVSFDGAHGGTEWVHKFLRLEGVIGLSEESMNGTSDEDGSYLDEGGWNYQHRLGPSNNTTTLLISNDKDSTPIDGIISPYSSALGIGRTVLPWKTDEASGYCERFVHGYLSYALHDTHSIQNVEGVALAAADFFAHDRIPAPGPDFAWTKHSLVKDEDIWAPGCTVMGASVDPPEGVISLTDVVDTPAGTTLVAAISPYEPGTMRVTGAMSGAGASLDVLDSFGLPLPKSNDTSGTLGDMTIMSFEVSPGPGDGEQYRLVAGSTEEATFFGSFVRLDRPELSLELDEYRAAVGSPIPVRASLLDSGGAALTDFAGTMDADLQGLDPQSVTLTDDGTGSDAVAGDGIFSGDIPAVAAADVYHLVVTASGTSATEGVVFRRVIEGQLVSAAHASVLGYMGPTLVDTNGNGLAETLLLEFQTDIAAAGEYAVTGRLLGGGQDYPVSAGVVATTVPSSPVVGLAIPASVVQLAANAQLELRELVMLDTDGVESFVPFGDVVLGAFDPAQFEPLPGPVLQNLTPNTGGFLGGGTVLLRGEHLEHVEVVKFGGREAGFEVLTGDTLSVVVPPWVDPPAGGIGAARELPKKKKVVRVVVDGPTGSAVLTKAFTYLRWE